MFEKILVPLDGSEHSLKALNLAVQIAKNFNSKITLINVFSVSAPVVMPEPTTLTPPTVPIMAAAELSKLAENARKTASNILAEGEKRAEAEGVKVETLIREGHTVQEIVKAAKEGEFNLIVMGARGIGKIKGILLGSVSDGVVKNAPCPVLIVK
ncbi:MAG: universal stress protein [Candidatus Bathyarchaeia archaeon]